MHPDAGRGAGVGRQAPVTLQQRRRRHRTKRNRRRLQTKGPRRVSAAFGNTWISRRMSGRLLRGAWKSLLRSQDEAAASGTRLPLKPRGPPRHRHSLRVRRRRRNAEQQRAGLVRQHHPAAPCDGQDVDLCRRNCSSKTNAISSPASASFKALFRGAERRVAGACRSRRAFCFCTTTPPLFRTATSAARKRSPKAAFP